MLDRSYLCSTGLQQTSSNAMHLVLNEEVDERHQGTKESTSKVLPVLDSLRVWWAQGNASQGPRQGCHNVRNHENVMPVMIVRRGDISPAAARESAKNTHGSNEAGQLSPRFSGKKVEKADQGETRSWAKLAIRTWAVAVVEMLVIPDVMAIKIMKKDRSGYRSPIVADTDGNHSWGYP